MVKALRWTASLAVLVALWPAPVPAQAQGTPAADCVHPDDPGVDYHCAAIWLARAEGQLRFAYDRLLGRLELLNKTDARKLRESHAAWLRYREADVELVGHHYGAQGTRARAIAAWHALRLTRDRIRQLEIRLAELEDYS